MPSGAEPQLHMRKRRPSACTSCTCPMTLCTSACMPCKTTYPRGGWASSAGIGPHRTVGTRKKRSHPRRSGTPHAHAVGGRAREGRASRGGAQAAEESLGPTTAVPSQRTPRGAGPRACRKPPSPPPH
eukprot:8370007-Alexandrium_andersonii.AAC.2